MEPFTNGADLAGVLAMVVPSDRSWLARAQSRQAVLTKPAGSLGRLEEIAERVCAIQRTLAPRVDKRRHIVCAGDHGVTAEGVNPFPPEVTAQMVANFCAGGAAINALAKTSGAELWVVDVGVARDIPGGGEHVQAGTRFVSRRVRAGTANFAHGPALTEDEVRAAIGVGLDLAAAAVADGVEVIGLGDMGIGNTTTTSAITAALTGLPAASVTGRGTGADDAMVARKVATIDRAIAMHRPDPGDALDILRKVCGLEIAALCGLTLGAAAARRVVVTDGPIATVAAALAFRFNPAVADYLFAGHLSMEPSHRPQLDLLGLTPILDLGMRLGEGTGAVLAMNVIGGAVAAFREMATFDGAGVTDRAGAAAGTETVFAGER